MNMKDIQQKIKAEETERLNAKIEVLSRGICVDLSGIWKDCETAGYRSYSYYAESGKGQNQCSNTIEGSTCGILGEAASEIMFSRMGIKYSCGWRDWITGVANDTNPDGMIGEVGQAVEVKTIKNIEYPLGQITCSMAQKYAYKNTIVVFVFIDTLNQLAYVYAMASAKDIISTNKIEKNLKGADNFQAIGVTDMEALKVLFDPQ
ncbi:hypothetical protein [Aeromonas sobria]|uniref:hypothetical protein n=1 Tax=Aeromonas sobria TaxID=646 RepID=UPI000C6D30F6|nr:hypothetical protein [Aeromonas sobria]PKQ78096.1 hypothetical protein CJF47_07390 [Aeromonas sobria]